MTNEDRGAIVELIDDLRSYTHDWDWKYGAFWDAEITRVRSILTALSAGEGLRVFKDESGLWVAHDVERDVVGQGKTRTAAVRGLAEAEESQDVADAHIAALAAPAPQEETTVAAPTPPVVRQAQDCARTHAADVFCEQFGCCSVIEAWEAGLAARSAPPAREDVIALRHALGEVVRSREIAWNALDEIAAPDSKTAKQMRDIAWRAREASAESTIHAATPASAPEAKEGTPFSRIFGAMPEIPNPDTGLDDDPAPPPRCRRCNDTGRIEVDYDDPSMLMGGQGTERCPACQGRK